MMSDFSRCLVCHPGHDGRDRRCKRATLITVVWISVRHQQRAQISVTESESPEKMAVFIDAVRRLNEIGVYDVVLPFILIFVIIFAALQKTRVLGTEEVEGHKYGKKNLNLVVGLITLLITHHGYE